MNIQILITIIITVIVTSLVWYIFLIKQKVSYSNLQKDHSNLNQNLDKEIIIKTDKTIKSLENTINDLNIKIYEVKQNSYLEGYEKARSEFSIKIFPFKKEHLKGDSGWFINDIFHTVEIGYQYQLFLNGIPILQPAVIIEETLTEEKKEVDYKKISNALNLVQERLLPIIAESKGLIKLVQKSKIN